MWDTSHNLHREDVDVSKSKASKDVKIIEIIINMSEHQEGSGLTDPVAQLLNPDWLET